MAIAITASPADAGMVKRVIKHKTSYASQTTPSNRGYHFNNNAQLENYPAAQRQYANISDYQYYNNTNNGAEPCDNPYSPECLNDLSPASGNAEYYMQQPAYMNINQPATDDDGINRRDVVRSVRRWWAK